jgi:hypothetical protein
MIPDYAKPLLKNLLARAFGSKSGYDTELLQAARFLEESGVSVDFSSLEGIQKIIIQFHKNRNSVGF